MGKILFGIARSKYMGSIVGFVFTYFPFLIPIKKVMQSKKAISFLHPKPVYQDHVLIIPRKIAKNIFALTSDDFIAIIDMAIHIRHGNRNDYSLVINGGDRQDVMQAHFHLFSGNLASKKGLHEEQGKAFLPPDEPFWKHLSGNIKDCLLHNGLSEKSFSMLVQFEADVDPKVYFI